MRLGIRSISDALMPLKVEASDDRRGLLAIGDGRLIGGGVFRHSGEDAVRVYDAWALASYPHEHWAGTDDVHAVVITEAELVRALHQTFLQLLTGAEALVQSERDKRAGTLEALDRIVQALPDATLRIGATRKR